MSYLITNARVFDGTGREPFLGAVRVEGNRITQVTPGAAAPAPDGATVINGAGATLMPGLIESHAHIGLADLGSLDLTRLPVEEHMLVTVRNASTMLDCGYTSAFSAAAPKPRLAVVLKREIEGARGLRVAAHCRSAESVMMALRHGVEVIYHANYADERALDALEAARDRIFVGPALGITYNLSQAAGQWGVTGERSRAFEHELAVTVDVVGRMRKRGIRVLPGGDYGFPYTPHGTYARDLWLFVKILGFSAMDTIVAATKLGGEIMGRPGELGVVTTGALADLLLVDGDPLANIEILQDRGALRMIMKDGALHKAPR